MKTCLICGNQIKARVVIDGKVVNTQRRKYCYDCSPFGSGNNKLLKGNKTKEEVEEILSRRKDKRLNRAKSPAFIKNQKKVRKERKAALILMLGGKCSRCGYDRCFRALEFHHIDENGKSFSLSVLGYTCSWERLTDEAKKCILLCANCHRELEEEKDNS
jgi:hypothetical protein